MYDIDYRLAMLAQVSVDPTERSSKLGRGEQGIWESASVK